MPSSTLRCPRGHTWDPAEFDDEAGPPDAPLACPYCGALCAVAPEPATRIQPATKPDPEAEVEPNARPAIPGYQILDILGRGGMGVVCKARQVRTDRVVALKVPGYLDLETRVRFTTEAQAAARVSHPHIVQVYEVGEHQGRPFLALEYVDGGTLADKLTGVPLPPRAAAALTEILARAVGAAHTHGVVHRDLKPANVLCSSQFRVPSSEATHSKLETRTWELKVADFGLARRIDADTGQTQSGTILGTPDYMSPEQAAGRNKEVGPAADVYSLGAILYELLTGRAPFKGTGMLETLEQVRTLDPVPPRRLQPGVPRDLETICLKCLQKDAARRYPVAGELADDLDRFLAGEPVLARPVSSLERWVKRARRNPLAAGLAGGLWLVLIAAAAYGIWYQVRLQTQRDKARHSLQVAIQSIEEWLTTEVADDTLDLEPRAELKRQDLLKKALAFYEQLLREEPDDPELAWYAAKGAVRVGDIHRLLGRHADALVAYDKAVDRLTPLAAHPLAGTDPAREIAYCHTFVGEVHRLRGDPAAATASYRRALDVQERLRNADPNNPGYRQDLSRTHYNLGIVARETGDPADAVSELTAAARLLDGLPADDMIQRRHRARIDLNLGPALRADHRLGEAAAACDRAITLFDALIAEHPDRYAFRYEREMAVLNRGLVRLSDRDPAKAEADLTSARDALARLVNDFKHTPLYRAGLAKAYNGLAAVAFDTGRADEAADMSAKAADQWTALIAQQGTADYHGELGISLCNRGRALYGSNAKAAKDLLTRGLTELLIGLRANPQEPAFNDTFQKQSRVLAGLLVWDQDRTGAEKLAHRIVAELPDPVRSTHRAVVLLAACAAAVGHQKRPAAEADGYEALAIELVTAVRPADWSALRADPDCAPLMARPRFAAAVAP